MSKPETTFISSIHRRLPTDLYRIKNNNTYNAGQADVWYSGPGGDPWIEYKFISVPVRDSTVIDLVGGKVPELSHLQQDWLRSRHAEGRTVGVIVGSKDGGVWFPGGAWDTTYTAKDFREWLLSRDQLAKIIIGLTT